MSFYEKSSAFLLRNLEAARLLRLNISYAILLEAIFPLFTAEIRDFLDMKQVGNLDNLFITLRNYEQRHSPRSQINPAGPSRVQKALSSSSRFQQNRQQSCNDFRLTRGDFVTPHQSFRDQAKS